MKFLSDLKKKISNEPEQDSQEVYDLKTGSKIKIVKVKQPDGSFTIKKVEDNEMPDVQLPSKESVESSISIPEEPSKQKPKKSIEQKTGPGGKVDLVALLDENITKVGTLKEERDTLLQEVLTLRSQIKELDTHKSAKEEADDKISELEDAIVKLKDDKAELEETVTRLKEERNSVEEKLKKYENVLLKVKDRVLDLHNIQ